MNPMTALMSQVELYIAQRDFDRAALLVKEAKQFDPASLEPDVMMASIALHVGQPKEAQVILDGVIQRQPKHGRARLLRGLVHETREEFAAALESFKLATRFDPDSMPAWFNQGRLMLKHERIAEAAIAFERAAALAPDNVAVLACWAQCLVKLGFGRRAANLYLRCIEQNVANPFFLVELAELLVKEGERALAEEVLAAGSKIFESQGLFDAKLSALALERRDVAKAVRHAREAVKRQPEAVEFLLALAALETMRLNLDEARGAAERALKLTPSDWRIHHQLGIVFEAASLKEKAISFYRRAVELAPEQWTPRNNLAVLLLEQRTPGADKEAKTHLELAVKHGGASATAHFNLALSQLRAGEKAQARQSATAASKLGAPGNEIALQARELATALA